MVEVVRPYRGVSADERRAIRRAQLLDACLDVVLEVGVADTTAEAICARAGLSKRYFYESFSDRDAALVAALDEVYRTVGAAIAEVFEAPEIGPDQRIRSTVVTLVDALSADLRIARLYVEARRSIALERRRIQAFDEFARLLAAGIIDAPEDDVVAYTTALMVVSGTTEVVSRWLAGDLPFTEPELVDLVTQLGAVMARATAEPRRPATPPHHLAGRRAGQQPGPTAPAS